MNKNDQFHGAEFEINAQSISDEELEAVSGGYGEIYGFVCPYCGEGFFFKDLLNCHIEDMHPQSQTQTQNS